MCNNNGSCPKLAGGAMCPSCRVTRDEHHLTRGQAISLRLAISGQLGARTFTSTAMKETMSLCVGCRACRHECPTGVDMAKMQVKFLYQFHARHGLPLRERLVEWLPRYAPWMARLRGLANLRDRAPGLAWLSQRPLGLAAGQVGQARAGAKRTMAALLPLVARGARVVGPEPPCLLTPRDGFHGLLPGKGAKAPSWTALLPAVRAAAAGDWIVADGTNCRSQIQDGTGRQPQHVVRVLGAYLPEPG